MPQQSLSSCSAFPGPFERSSFWEFLIFMMKTNKQRHRETFESAGRAMRALGNPRLAASIEFEVKDADTVAVAGGELQRAGFEQLHPARTEPWGQTVARFLTEDGLILGISYIPSFHKKETA
jgi:hypothetical protein